MITMRMTKETDNRTNCDQNDGVKVVLVLGS